MKLGGQEDRNNFDEGGNNNDHSDNRAVKQLAIAFSLECQALRYVHCVVFVVFKGEEGIVGCAFMILYVFGIRIHKRSGPNFAGVAPVLDSKDRLSSAIAHTSVARQENYPTVVGLAIGHICYFVAFLGGDPLAL